MVLRAGGGKEKRDGMDEERRRERCGGTVHERKEVESAREKGKKGRERVFSMVAPSCGILSPV